LNFVGYISVPVTKYLCSLESEGQSLSTFSSSFVHGAGLRELEQRKKIEKVSLITKRHPSDELKRSKKEKRNAC